MFVLSVKLATGISVTAIEADVVSSHPQSFVEYRVTI